MSKRVLGIVGAVVGLLVVAVVVVLMRPVSGGPVPTAPAEVASPAAEESADVGTTPGAYVEYGDDVVAKASGRILLFFHAPWCPQCRSIESDILADGVPAGVTIVKVDYDSRQDIRERYGVTLQTTFVEVDATGAEVQQHVAYDDPHLAAILAAML